MGHTPHAALFCRLGRDLCFPEQPLDEKRSYQIGYHVDDGQKYRTRLSYTCYSTFSGLKI